MGKTAFRKKIGGEDNWGKKNKLKNSHLVKTNIDFSGGGGGWWYFEMIDLQYIYYNINYIYKFPDSVINNYRNSEYIYIPVLNANEFLLV